MGLGGGGGQQCADVGGWVGGVTAVLLVGPGVEGYSITNGYAGVIVGGGGWGGCYSSIADGTKGGGVGYSITNGYAGVILGVGGGGGTAVVLKGPEVSGGGGGGGGGAQHCWFNLGGG